MNISSRGLQLKRSSSVKPLWSRDKSSESQRFSLDGALWRQEAGGRVWRSEGGDYFSAEGEVSGQRAMAIKRERERNRERER